MERDSLGREICRVHSTREDKANMHCCNIAPEIIYVKGIQTDKHIDNYNYIWTSMRRIYIVPPREEWLASCKAEMHNSFHNFQIAIFIPVPPFAAL